MGTKPPGSHHGHIQMSSQTHWKSPGRAPTPRWDTEAFSIPPPADAESKINEVLVSQEMRSGNSSPALCSGHPQGKHSAFKIKQMLKELGEEGQEHRAFLSLPLGKAGVVWRYNDPHQTSSRGWRKQAGFQV